MSAAKSSPFFASCAMSAAVKFLLRPRRESEEVESRSRRSCVRRTMLGAEATVSRQPTLPHVHSTPSGSIVMWPNSPANPDPPPHSSPPLLTPPPTPLPPPPPHLLPLPPPPPPP